MSKTMKGTLMTLIYRIAWSLSGAYGQCLMAHGFTAIGLTTIRLVFSGATTASCILQADQESKGLLTDFCFVIHPPCFLFAFLGLLMTQLTLRFRRLRSQCRYCNCFAISLSYLAYSCVMPFLASEIIFDVFTIAGTFLIGNPWSTQSIGNHSQY